MKTETLELIIEELARALNTERWVNKTLSEENAKLKAELAEVKKLLDSKCDACVRLTEGE